jgi:hypothetical protein
MSTMQLLNSVPMLRNLSASAERELHMVNAVGMEDSERSCASFGVRTPIGRVVAELKDEAGFSER